MMHASTFLHNPVIGLRRDHPEQAMLFNPDTGQNRYLNETGFFIWEHCDGQHDIPAIAAAMVDAYEGVTISEAEAQVTAFLDQLAAANFILVKQHTAAPE